MRLLTTTRIALGRALTVATVLCLAGCSEGGKPPAAPTPVPAPSAPTPAPGPTPVPAPTPVPVEPVTVSKIELNPQEISGQSSSVATVTLTGPAPEGGALVNLQSTNRDVAKVPATLLIPAGEKSGTARVESSTVTDITRVSIIAQYGGVSNGATLTVGFDPLSAAFVVRNSCQLLDLGRLTCDFDASASKGRISTYRWAVRTTRQGLLEWETNGAIATPVPPSGCAFFSGLGNPPGNPNGFTIQVELQVVGRNGERTEVVSRFVGVSGYGVCGYPRVAGT